MAIGDKVTGRVIAVEVKPMGSALTSAYTAGDTHLHLVDPTDFDNFIYSPNPVYFSIMTSDGTTESEEIRAYGGTTVADDGITYGLVFDDEVPPGGALVPNTVWFGTPLTNLPEADAAVYLYPRAYTRYCQVKISEDDNDVVYAAIPKGLASQLLEGTRSGITQQEIVVIEYDEDEMEWYVVDMPSAPALLDGTVAPFRGAVATTSADQSITKNTDVVLAYDTVSYDTMGLWKSVTSKMQIPTKSSGYYQVTASCMWTPSGGTTSFRQIQIAKDDGVTITVVATNATHPIESGNHYCRVSCIEWFNEGDKIFAYARHNSATGTFYSLTGDGTKLEVIFQGTVV
jgi:hypothetical protein